MDYDSDLYVGLPRVVSGKLSAVWDHGTIITLELRGSRGSRLHVHFDRVPFRRMVESVGMPALGETLTVTRDDETGEQVVCRDDLDA